jgi:hypothetical protein
MAVDQPCSHCGREPSHPQVRHRFVYAAYYRVDLVLASEPRCYVAALCESCYDADRQARSSTARNRFLGRVRRWSGQPDNRARAVRLIEHPEGVTGEEWESDTCFQDGVAGRCGTPATPGNRRNAPGT